MKFAQEGLQLANKLDVPEFISLLATRIGEIHGSQGLLEESRKYCAISERNLDRVNDLYLAAQVYLLLADVYIFRGDYASGDRNLQMALKHDETVKNKLGIAKSKVSLSWLYSLTGMWDHGLKVCEEALDFFNQYQDIYHIGLSVLNIAKFYCLATICACYRLEPESNRFSSRSWFFALRSYCFFATRSDLLG